MLERALSVASSAGAGLPNATVLCIVAQHRFMPCCTVHGFILNRLFGIMQFLLVPESF